MKDSLAGQVKWYRLWWNQDKECPVCKEKITKEAGWHVHHILPKSEGGKDNLSNLVMVHPNCHRQIHSQKLKVGKTGSREGALERLEQDEGKLSSPVLRGGSVGNAPCLALDGCPICLTCYGPVFCL